MRASVASISKKIISILCAAVLTVGLVPAAAFAEPIGDAAAPQSSESAGAGSGAQAEAEASANENDPEEDDGGSADPSQHVISSEGDEVPEAEKSRPSDEGEGTAQAGEGASSTAALPAGDIINQEVALDTVAQAESTRSFFLAQTLESTKTVPVVSAKLPIDTGANDAADAPAEDRAPSSEGEGSGDSNGASGSDDPVDPSFTLGSSEGDSAAVAAESTVIGSFTYLGMTFAIEPGGESVALMAADYSKLPEEYIQKQVLVIPDTVTPDGIDYYSVTRIADDAFASLTKESANPDYTGCEALFSDEELLAEAGIDPSEVQEFLSEPATTDVAEEGESADADSQDMPKDEPWAYEDQDQATSDPAIVSSVVDLNDGDASNHVISSDKDEASPTNVISSGVSGANGVEKSRPSDEDGGEASADSDNNVRTIVSMDGNVATLDDGSTYTFTNPLAGCAGILALGIPASVTDIGDDAFTGFTTLQYVVVSEDNQSYASYDGVLYSADSVQLRLIPEGRVGAVRVAPSATGVDPEVFSHCPSVDALVADAEGEVSSILPSMFDSVLLDWTITLKADAASISDVSLGLRGSNGVFSKYTVAGVGQVNVSGEYGKIVADFWAPKVNAAGGYYVSSRDYVSTTARIVDTGSETGNFGTTSTTEYRHAHRPGSNEGRLETCASSGWIMTGSGAIKAGSLTFYGQYYAQNSHRYLSFSTAVGLHMSGSDSNPWLGQLFRKSDNSPVFCEQAIVHGSNTILIPPPYSIRVTLHGSWKDNERNATVHGDWAGGSEITDSSNRRTDFTQRFDSGIVEGTSNDVVGEVKVLTGEKVTGIGFNSPYTLPTPNSNIGEYVFVGWSKNKNAKASDTSGWYYRVDGKYGIGANAQITETTESVDLYAVYQRGYPINLNVSTFGGSTAEFGMMPATSGNDWTVDGNNGQEVVTVTDTANSTGTFRFPRAKHPKNNNGSPVDPAFDDADDGMKFLGWTNDASGGFPVDKDGNRTDYYFKHEDGNYTVSATSFTGASRTFNVSMADSTWYAVWETDVTFDAANYGGKIEGDTAGTGTTTITVKNNQPIPADSLPAIKTADAVDGNIVPNTYSTDGYDPAKWTFKGWSTQPNPNAPDGGDTPDSSGLGCRSGSFTEADASQALIPDGATTYYGVWECDVSWAADEDRPSPAEINEKAAADYLYGYRIQAPGVRDTPPSHHFSHWSDTAGNQVPAHDGTYVVRTGGPVTAYWAPNERVVALNGNGAAASQDQRTYAKYGEDMALRKANAEGTGLDYTGVGSLAVPTREGYEFAGYWNTRYTEDATRMEDGVPLTDGGTLNDVVPKQYYGVEGGQLTSLTTWDITNDAQQLFAHWRYRIYLNLNTFNADGEAVLKDAVDADGNLIPQALYSFAAELKPLPQNGSAAYTEQSAIASDASEATHAVLGEGTRAVAVQDDASAAGKAGYTDLAYERFAFTAIDGQPIQLPQVTGREGYDDTLAWKAMASSPTALTLDGNGVTEGTSFFPALADTAGGIDGKALVLAADWSGKAKRYKVTLQSTYVHDATSHSFKGTPETQVIDAVYDQPLLMPDMMNVTPTAVAPTYQNQDSLRDNPTNLVFQGFHNEKNGAFTGKGGIEPAGKRYIAVSVASDGTRTAATAEEEYGTSASTRPVRFREPSAGADASGNCTATLYALWGYPQVVVSFDYQGGTSSDLVSGASVPEVTRELTTLDPMPTDLAVPTRTGYAFNGFWTTKWNESDPATQFYGSDMKPTDAHEILQSTVDLPLYAHWTYYVRIDKNLPDTDKAELDTSFAATNTTMVNATARLAADLPAAGEAPDYVDAFGNRFFESTDDKGTSTITIQAVAGAPVELKAVHDRTLLDGAPTGYDNTATFTTLRNGASTTRVATALVDGKPTTSEYPAREAYPTPLVYLSGGVPGNVEGGMTAGDAYVVTLYADWSESKQDFWAQLTYSYDEDVLDAATQQVVEAARYEACTEDGHENGHASFADPEPIMVTYDEPVVAAGETLAADQITNHAFSEVTPTGGTEAEVHANLDLVGLFAADLNESGHVTAFRSKYVDAAGASSNDTGCNLAFREYYLPAKVNAGDSAALQQQARANAVRLYAEWAEPTRAVLFNYYDNAQTSDSTQSAAGDGDALTLQKGDAVADVAPADALQAIAQRVKQVDNQKDPAQDKRYATYEFAGFWTHPFYEGAYDDGEVSGFSKQYFAMNADGTSLKAVSPVAEGDPQRATWEEDRTTTLYAHWKYAIEVDANPVKPAATGSNWSGGADMLYFVGAGSSMEDDSAAVQTLGTVIYGSDTFIQHDPALIQRTRDFDLTDGRDIRRAGYGFDGWYEGYSASSGFSRPVAYLDEEASGSNALTDTRTLTPGPDKKVTLHAKWEQERYTVDLVASNAESAYPDFFYNGQLQTIANEGVRTRQVTVAYDEPLPGPITAPDMTGYAFLGYCTDQQTAAPTMSDGRYAYASAWPARVMHYDGATMLDGDVVPSATAEPWVLASPTPALEQTAKLYAHYYQKPLSVTFNLIHGDDAARTLEQPQGSSAFAQASQRTWYYGKPLSAADLPASASFARYGYRFDGWYYLASDGATRVFLSDGSGDIVMNSQHQWLLDAPRTDLFAAWTPLTYTVEFYYDFPNSQPSARPSVTLEGVCYEDEFTATEVANPLALVAGEVPRVSHDPYRFAGWSTDPNGTSGYWLLANDGSHDDNRTDEGFRLKEEGRFMPQAGSVITTVDGARRVVYHAQWHDLESEYLLLFPGNHGRLSDGWTADGRAVLNATDRSVVARQLTNIYDDPRDLSADNINLGLEVDAGWQLKGWAKVPTDELPSGVTKGDSMGCELAQTPEASAINAKERTDDALELVPNSFDCMNDARIPFGTYYLVAVYAQDGDFEVALDANAPATAKVEFGLWAVSGTSYRFSLYGRQEDGAYEKHGPIVLPTAARKGYSFCGWERYALDEAGNVVMENGAPKVVERLGAGDALNLDAWASESQVGSAHRSRTYHATWKADDYTIRLHMNRTDDASLGEVLTATYDGDGFELPYPASKQAGGFFLGYDVNPQGTGSNGSMFFPEDMREQGAAPYTVNGLLDAVEKLLTDTERTEHQPDLGSNAIDLYARWNYRVSATMPVQVLIKMDPDTGDIITAPTKAAGGEAIAPTQVSETAAGAAGSEAGSNTAPLSNYPLEVVALRYERPAANGVFDVDDDVAGGAAYLSVYADQADLDFTGGGNVNKAGEVMDPNATDPNATVTYRPLKIDLSEDDQIIGVEALRDHGFRSFWGVPDVLPNDLLPLCYGVVFEGTYSDGGQPRSLDAAYFVKKGQIDLADRDTDHTAPIAYLYYTVKRAE